MSRLRDRVWLRDLQCKARALPGLCLFMAGVPDRIQSASSRSAPGSQQSHAVLFGRPSGDTRSLRSGKARRLEGGGCLQSALPVFHKGHESHVRQWPGSFRHGRPKGTTSGIVATRLPRRALFPEISRLTTEVTMVGFDVGWPRISSSFCRAARRHKSHDHGRDDEARRASRSALRRGSPRQAPW